MAKSEMEPKNKNLNLPENLRLPDKPTQEDLMLFLGQLVLAWDELTPQQRQQAFDYFDQKTKHLEKPPKDSQL